MFYTLKRSCVWVRRMRYSKGFGVQSPWAYKFVREVVNNHTRYEIYNTLKHHVFGLDKRKRKLCRLYYRMAKFVNPNYVIDFHPEGTAYKAYFLAGCNKNTYRLVSNHIDREAMLAWLKEITEKTVLVRVTLEGGYDEFVNDVLDYLSATSVVIIEHIHKDKHTTQYWKQLVADSRVGVSFDLYYCGVLFLNTKMYKQNYIINF
ncbi:hypothetical protein [Prevotella bivia]|uniref:hypothetical protein n=1 Tax=Prevotella bivia TaxID=28125 RepID=UPI00288A723A|nr:hypothetical protein [Prevotella bivia]